MKSTLLIAEGHAELCGIYEKFLTEHGYAVETASDGLTCLEKLRRLIPAVLVLDWELCWGGGEGVLTWLREQRAAPHVPVVLTTAAGYSVDVAKNIKPPVVKFLPKPFTLTALLDSVLAAVAKKGPEQSFNLNRVASHSAFFIG